MIYEIKAELLEKQIEKLKELNHILSEMASYASCITNPHMLTLREERKKLESELAALDQEQKPEQPVTKELTDEKDVRKFICSKIDEKYEKRKGTWKWNHASDPEWYKPDMSEVARWMEEYATQHKETESTEGIDKEWIFEIIDKTNQFAKQLIKDHFNRHETASQNQKQK
jgi:predicted HTH domain antitoxin